MDYGVMCIYHLPDDPRLWPGELVGYHITRAERVASILRDGLQAQASQATWTWERRAEAVYFFAARQDAYDIRVHKALFGAGADLAVIRVHIPRRYWHLMREDGMFNVSIICRDGSYPTGVQYMGDIPPAWIELDIP